MNNALNQAASSERMPAAPSDAMDEGCIRKALGHALRECDTTNAQRMAIYDAFIPRWKRLLAAPGAAIAAREQFQQRVRPWMMACFGEKIAADRKERNHRFLEEALELVQACGCTASEAHQLVDYTFGRPVGEKAQEVGGVMVTLAALCLANDIDMHAEGETELARIWTMVEKIRAKQAAKPKHSPLPEEAPATPQGEALAELRRALAVIGVVGQIDGHDVVRRLSVLEMADRAALPQAATAQQAETLTPDDLFGVIRGTGYVTRGQAQEITELVLSALKTAPTAAPGGSL